MSTRNQQPVTAVEDLQWLVKAHNEKHRQFCHGCGGRGQVRVCVTGNPLLDYAKCTACNGHGTPQPTQRSILEKATNHAAINYFNREPMRNKKQEFF